MILSTKKCCYDCRCCCRSSRSSLLNLFWFSLFLLQITKTTTATVTALDATSTSDTKNNDFHYNLRQQQQQRNNQEISLKGKNKKGKDYDDDYDEYYRPPPNFFSSSSSTSSSTTTKATTSAAAASAAGAETQETSTTTTTGAVSWESVHAYRTRLNIDFGYTPNFINEELCHFITDESECEAMDTAMEQRAFHTKSLSQTNHELKTLVVLIQWQDHTTAIRNLIPVDHIDQLWNAPLGSIDPILYPSGSMKDYISTNSYGKLQIQADVIDWQMTDGTEAYYADGHSGLYHADATTELRFAFHYVLNQMEANDFPFEEYDSDGDLEIDSIIFLHSGYGASEGVTDCETGALSQDRIWAHASSENWRDNRWVSPSTGIQLGPYAVASAYRSNCGEKIARIGVLAHEYLHTLGLPDLYDVDGKYGNNYGVGGLGSYDVMSNPAGPIYQPKWPGMLSPWSKIQMGWLTPIEISIVTQKGESSSTYLARPSELHPDVYIIRQGYESGEYLLIENRQPISYDSKLRGQGILIYHIDENAAGNPNNRIRGNRNRGFPGQPGWPGNGNHYPVALLQADGSYELEKSINDRDEDDFYNNLQQRLGPGNGELEAAATNNQGLYPNTDSYANGNIRATGLVIDHFQEMGEAGTFSFRVNFQTNTEAPSSSPTESPCIHEFEIELKTDMYGRETSWELLNDSTGHTIAEKGNWREDDQQDKLGNRQFYQERLCLDPNELYTFTIYDSYGDGMCCNYTRGWYKLWLNDILLLDGNGDFGFSTSTTFST